MIYTEFNVEQNPSSLPPTFVVVDVAGPVVAALHASPAGPGVVQHHGGQRGEVTPVIDCPEPGVVRPGQGTSGISLKSINIFTSKS